MQLYCSNLPNDQDMIQALGSAALPVPLACGDYAFFGVGDDNRPLRIAVERKKIGDLAACILGGRYVYQAQRAKEAGFDVLVLIVEGRIHCNPDDGLLEIPVWGISPRTLRRCQVYEPIKPAMTYSRFDQFLTEVDYLAGIIVKRSENVQETATIIKALWVNFQTPPDKHNSLHQIYTQPSPHVLLRKPGLVRRVAKEIDHIGWERSAAVAEKFPTIRAMVNASEAEWRGVAGIGKKIARSVVQSLGGEAGK